MGRNPLCRMVALALLCLVPQLWGAGKPKEATDAKGVVSFSEQYTNSERNDPEDQMVLSDDLVNTSGVSELRVGDEPTPQQLKEANTDMVWIKEEEVAGFKIQIPVVYINEEEDDKKE